VRPAGPHPCELAFPVQHRISARPDGSPCTNNLRRRRSLPRPAAQTHPSSTRRAP
jgi:hypothetical protein